MPQRCPDSRTAWLACPVLLNLAKRNLADSFVSTGICLLTWGLGGLGHQSFHVGHTLLKNLLQDLGVLELLGDLCDDGVGQFLLLALLDLTFVADPGVQDILSLGGQSGLLLEFKSLGLESGGFL